MRFEDCWWREGEWLGQGRSTGIARPSDLRFFVRPRYLLRLFEI